MYESRESPCEAAFSSLFKDAKKLLFLLLMLFCVFVFSRLIAHVLLLFCTFSKELYNLRFYFEVFYFHVQLLVLDFLFLTPDRFIGWNYIFIIVKDVIDNNDWLNSMSTAWKRKVKLLVSCSFLWKAVSAEGAWALKPLQPIFCDNFDRHDYPKTPQTTAGSKMETRDINWSYFQLFGKSSNSYNPSWLFPWRQSENGEILWRLSWARQKRVRRVAVGRFCLALDGFLVLQISWSISEAVCFFYIFKYFIKTLQ